MIVIVLSRLLYRPTPEFLIFQIDKDRSHESQVEEEAYEEAQKEEEEDEVEVQVVLELLEVAVVFPI